MIEVRRDLCRPSGPTPYSSSNIYNRFPRKTFEDLHIGRLHNLHHPHSEGVLPDIQMKLLICQFVPLASCPVTGHNWKEPNSILFAPSFQVFIHNDKIPLDLLFFRMNQPFPVSPSSLDLSSQERCCSPLIISWPSTRLFTICPCLCCTERPRTDTVLAGTLNDFSDKSH